MNLPKPPENKTNSNGNFNKLSIINKKVNEILNTWNELVFENKNKQDFNIIFSFILKDKEFFKWYLDKYPELIWEHKKHIWKHTYFLNKIDLYINDFFDFLLSNLNIWVIYEPIVSKGNWVELKESLLRIKPNTIWDINHAKLIDIFSLFWKEFLIFEYVLFIVLSDLINSKVALPLSINLHKDDLLNPNIFKVIEEYENYFSYSIKEQSWSFFLELIEKWQPLNDSKEIQNVKSKLDWMWYILILDDLLHDEQNINQALNSFNIYTTFYNISYSFCS